MPIRLQSYGSWFRFDYADDLPFVPLLVYYLLLRRIYIREIDQLCFFSTEHTDEIIQLVGNGIKDSVLAMQQAGFLPASPLNEAPAKITPFPTTDEQQASWLISQVSNAASSAFNVGWVAKIAGKLDVSAMTYAIQTVIKRHEALQVRFSLDGSAQQRALYTHVRVPVLDYAGKIDPDTVLAQLSAEDGTRPLNLTHGPVIRVKIVRLETYRHALLLMAHQVVFDELRHRFFGTKSKRFTVPTVRIQSPSCPTQHHTAGTLRI